MADHLQRRGLMILEPWITPANFYKRIVGFDYVDKPKLKIAHINISEVRRPVSAFEYRYLIGAPNKVRHIVDEEEMGLWTYEAYSEAVRDAGLEVIFQQEV